MAAGRTEVTDFGGEVVTGEVTAAEQVQDGLRVLLADGRSVIGRRMLVATGLVDELPGVPGLAQR